MICFRPERVTLSREEQKVAGMAAEKPAKEAHARDREKLMALESADPRLSAVLLHPRSTA